MADRPTEADSDELERERLLLALHDRWPATSFTFLDLKDALTSGDGVSLLDALPEWIRVSVDRGEFNRLASYLSKLAGYPIGESGVKLTRSWDRRKTPTYLVELATVPV